MSLLPQHPGVLPLWLLFVSLLSLSTALRCQFQPYLFHRTYNLAPPSSPVRQPTRPLSKSATSPDGAPALDALAARLFGTWTLLAAVIRLYAAYDFDNGPIYSLAMLTFALAIAHFGAEHAIWRTMGWGAAMAVAVAVPAVSLGWMGWAWWDGV